MLLPVLQQDKPTENRKFVLCTCVYAGWTSGSKGKVQSNYRHSSWQTLSGRHRTSQSFKEHHNQPTDLPTVRVRERKVISISMYPFGVLWSLMGHRGTIQLLPWEWAEISNTEIYNVYKYEHTLFVPYPLEHVGFYSVGTHFHPQFHSTSNGTFSRLL